MCFQMNKYMCMACKHSFTRNFEYHGKCPYCGKDEIKEVIVPENIIREVDDFWVKKVRKD